MMYAKLYWSILTIFAYLDTSIVPTHRAVLSDVDGEINHSASILWSIWKKIANFIHVFKISIKSIDVFYIEGSEKYLDEM